MEWQRLMFILATAEFTLNLEDELEAALEFVVKYKVVTNNKKKIEKTKNKLVDERRDR